MKKQFWISLLFALLILFPLSTVEAQEEQPEDGPAYIVQAGDTLWTIAQRFGVSLEALAQKNLISDPSQLSIGSHLIIPGLEGLQGVLVTANVPFGENLSSLARRYQIPENLLSRLNHFTSPTELYAGSTLIITERGEYGLEPVGGRAVLMAGQSLLELAVKLDTNPWSLMADNGLWGSWAALPAETLHISAQADPGPGALPPQVATLAADPFSIAQGQTIALKLSGQDVASVQGTLAGNSLNFFKDQNGRWVALQGVHAMIEPGLFPVELHGTVHNGTQFEFGQQLLIREAGYPYDPPLVVDSETVDVNNTTPEDLQWAGVVEPTTPQKMWGGIFQVPVDDYWADCITSWFGNRRSYNGSAYLYFHTGLDFCNNPDFGLNNIYAPAAGEVVFVGELIVRGNATVIDHGWGVYSAYGHQSEILVQVGDRVETGQLIGVVGETGRVSGPHLHWEVIVGGNQVDPEQWLAREFP